jgi:putative flavoprotein involved in K+ transport
MEEPMNDLLVEPGAAFERLSDLNRAPAERFDVIVIGGGQAGLSVGYHLKRKGLRFVILDASSRIGDAWRKRWDSLRLFTPAWLNALDGMPFPGPQDRFPTKDEMADYLESYARHFELPVRSSCKVERLSKQDGRFVVECSDVTLCADQVVVAMAGYQSQRVPELARELRADIVQLKSSDYKNPAQLAPGATLVVGGGNSGAEIAHDLSRTHAVTLAGPEVGAVPFRMTRLVGFLLMRVFFHRILSIRTPMGRKARPRMMHKATPLIRTKPDDLRAAGVELVAQRVIGVQNGLPQLADGQVLDVKNIVWSTGFNPRHAWIDLPVFDQDGEPKHEAGVVKSEPGLYFVGLQFLYSMSSSMVHGVGRDAKRIAGKAAARARAGAQARPAMQMTETLVSCAWAWPWM